MWLVSLRFGFWGTLLLTAVPAFAQLDDISSAGDNSVQTMHAPLTTEWKPVLESASRDKVKSLLEEEGWTESEISQKLSESESYDIYKMTVSPGTSNYITVPKSDTGKITQFGVSMPGTIQTAGYFLPSGDEIKQRILEGIRSSIDAICSMGSKPSQIRVQASAFGIVEIEATWDSSEVCQ